MRARAWRAAMVAVLAGGVLGALPASAGYPDVCFAAVSGLEQRRVIVVSDRAADAAVLDVVRRLGGRTGPRYAPLSMRAVELPSEGAREVALRALAALPGVRSVERERRYTVAKTATDPLAKQQWSIAKMGLPKAWDVETGRPSVVVAVLDTGVDVRHPDLKAKIVPGVDVVNDDEDPMDDQGHGTHVAGTIAASTNNRVGVAGVAWGARILPVKVLDRDGGGTSCDIAVGVVEAVQRGASIINLSLAGPTSCPVVWRAAFEYATGKNVLSIASSGNDALSGAPESAPANCAGVLGVGATDSADRPAVFSSFGPTVDVSAPGHEIMSTMFEPKSGRHTYGMLSGTSMAAPHVAGLAALIRSRHPSWTPAQVSERIVATSDDLGPRGRDDFYGVGRVNAARALAR